MTFNSYLRENGFSAGTRLTPDQASQQYALYQTALANNSIAQNQSSTSSGPAFGMVGGMASKFMGGGKGGTGGASQFSGSWAGVPQGAMAGFAAGTYNAQRDPNMSNKKDGFGEKYPDYRAQVGGTIAGGVMGYYGLGSIAAPVVVAAHPVMEPTTRALINFGDSWGGAGGALMMDPIGTVSSGKYSWEQLLKGAALGPFSKLVK